MYLVFSCHCNSQCLSCSFGQNQKVNIADMHYDYDYDYEYEYDYEYDNDKKRYKIGPLFYFFSQNCIFKVCLLQTLKQFGNFSISTYQGKEGFSLKLFSPFFCQKCSCSEVHRIYNFAVLATTIQEQVWSRALDFPCDYFQNNRPHLKTFQCFFRGIFPNQ